MNKLCQLGGVRRARYSSRAVAGFVWAITGISACSGSDDGRSTDPGAIPDVPSKLDPGTDVTLPAPNGLEELTSDLHAARASSASELRESHATAFATELGYDSLAASGLDPLLDMFEDANGARDAVERQGFAIAAEGSYPSFADGYAELYMRDLPVFISSDMVLEATYRSHDKLLQALEQKSLKPRLEHFLDALRSALARSDELSPEAASDLNFYLGVALSLLDGKVDSREPDGVSDFFARAVAAEGTSERILFGVMREIDFSQFKPRGHYAGDEELERYFRAMMWLGRTEFRLIETLPDGDQVLRRRQVESMIALRRLLDDQTFAEYTAIDDTITAFVGEHDYMALQEVDDLVAALGGISKLDDTSDEALANAIVEGQFGKQRIASQVMRRDRGGVETLPLSMSFALLGQRYTVDSHVFSNVVYDRVPTRVLPNPLDAAFAALGNDQALSLLGDEVDTSPEFAGELAGLRLLVDAHPEEYWQSSLYTGWLGALRQLSPVASDQGQLPTVARSEAWGRRMLNTQLASWAQLRHNNVLYVKQSYTSGNACEYPDAYVDPYPEFFDAMVDFGERGLSVFEALDVSGDFADQATTYFTNVVSINSRLARMARAQQSGEPHSAEDMAFINQAVVVDRGCGGPATHTGWYSQLHFEPNEAADVDPTITDVHTDVGGDLPIHRDPSVLHVGTALPRLMVTTFDSCEGPRAYAGVVFDYREVKADGLTRYTDEEWKDMVFTRDLPQVPWLESIVVQAASAE